MSATDRSPRPSVPQTPPRTRNLIAVVEETPETNFPLTPLHRGDTSAGFNQEERYSPASSSPLTPNAPGFRYGGLGSAAVSPSRSVIPIRSPLRRTDPGYFDPAIDRYRDTTPPANRYPIHGNDTENYGLGGPQALTDPLTRIASHRKGGPTQVPSPAKSGMDVITSFPATEDHEYRFYHDVEQEYRAQASQDLPSEGFSDIIEDSETQEHGEPPALSHTTPTQIEGTHNENVIPPYPPSPTTDSEVIQSAPAFSLTAGAAMGDEVIGGTKTLEVSSVGSEDTAHRKRHYEGCMLCSPLPSPSSSISSFCPEEYSLSPYASGPPPDMPLPPLNPQVLGMQPIKISAMSLFNPLKPFLLEGELASSAVDTIPAIPAAEITIPRRIYVPPPHLLGEPGPEISSSTHLNGLPVLTVMIPNEDNQKANRRGPSAEYRPSTRDTFESGEPSRVPMGYGNMSQNSLIDGAARIQEGIAGKPSNPFRHYPDLSAIQEAQSRRSSWRNVFGGPAAATVPGEEMADIELKPQKDYNFTNPHPGQRRDRPAMDGTYEIVDLASIPDNRLQPGVYQGQEDNAAKGLGHGGKKRWTCPGTQLSFRVKALIVVLLGVAAVMSIVLPIVYAGLPAMAQKTLDRTPIDVSSFSISDAQADIVNFTMGVQFGSAGHIQALGNPSSLRLALKGSNGGGVSSKMKRNHIPNHAPTDGNTGVLGYVTLAGPSSGTTATLGGQTDGEFSILDHNAWGTMLKGLILRKSGVEIQVEGSMKVRMLGVTASLNINKSTNIPGIGGLSVQAINSSLLRDQYGGFILAMRLNGRGPVSIDFDEVWFGLEYNSTIIGKAMAKSFSITPNGSDLVVQGTLSQETFINKPELLGSVLAALSADDNQFSLRGENATVPWMVPAVKSLQIPTPFKEETPHTVILKQLKPAFTVILDQIQTEIRSGFINSTIKLPFDTKKFNATVKDVGYKLELGTDNGKAVAVLGTALQPVVNDGNKTAVSFSQASFDVKDKDTFIRGFLKPLLQEDTFSLTIQGDVRTKVDTRLGRANVPEIKFEASPWILKGYGGFKDGATLEAPRIVNSTDEGLLVSVRVRIQGFGELPIHLGDVTFAVAYKGEAIGNVSIPAFNVGLGSNVYDGTLVVSTLQQRQAVKPFLAAFFGGGDTYISLALTAPSASTRPLVRAALQDIDLAAFTTSPGYVDFITKVLILLQTANSTTQAVVQVVNPFQLPMTVTGLALKMLQPQTGDELDVVEPSAMSRVLTPGESMVLAVDLGNGDKLSQYFETENGKDVKFVGTMDFNLGDAPVQIDLGFVKNVQVSNITRA